MGEGEQGPDSEHVWKLELIGSANGPDVGCERAEWRWNQGFSSEYLKVEVLISWDLNPITQDIFDVLPSPTLASLTPASSMVQSESWDCPDCNFLKINYVLKF